ncbi:FAD-binding protein, partial [Chloroflexota bacterium]
YHELARTFSLGSELLFLELIAHCSLARTESRGSHFREDYQEQDDVNWLKWVIAKREDDDIKVWTESIPFDKYRLKP